MDMLNEFFSGYHRETTGSYALIETVEELNWSHWVLILLGPLALLFWLAAGCYNTRITDTDKELTSQYLPLETISHSHKN